jgi:hypothetical protein
LGRKERYVLAMALLLVVGLSAAWAAGSSMATISFSTVSDFPSVRANKPSISLSSLKKNVWFYSVTTNVFSINVPPSTSSLKLWVRVGVSNMAQLANDFKALDINVTLKGDTKVDSDVISLGAGTSSVLLYLDTSTSTSADGTFKIDLYISGLPTTTSPDPIMLYCAIEPAEGVELSS